MMHTESSMTTSDEEIGRVIREFFSLDSYNWNQRVVDKPRVSREHDRSFFEFIWEHPEYEQFFDITP